MSNDSEPKYEYARMIDNGFERCVSCGIVFGAEDRSDDIRGEEHAPGISGGINYLYGPVRNADTGTEYEYVGGSPPGTYLTHPDCFKEIDAERKAKANQSLADFANGGTN